jgi:hypothetical protein
LLRQFRWRAQRLPSADDAFGHEDVRATARSHGVCRPHRAAFPVPNKELPAGNAEPLCREPRPTLAGEFGSRTVPSSCKNGCTRERSPRLKKRRWLGVRDGDAPPNQRRHRSRRETSEPNESHAIGRHAPSLHWGERDGPLSAWSSMAGLAFSGLWCDGGRARSRARLVCGVA